jgi:hypothetical protein
MYHSQYMGESGSTLRGVAIVSGCRESGGDMVADTKTGAALPLIDTRSPISDAGPLLSFDHHLPLSNFLFFDTFSLSVLLKIFTMACGLESPELEPSYRFSACFRTLPPTPFCLFPQCHPADAILLGILCVWISPSSIFPSFCNPFPSPRVCRPGIMLRNIRRGHI